jgi:alpha-tubulin suppressor-like RCC1 family protein
VTGGGYHSLHVWGIDVHGSVTQQSADVGVVLGPQMFALANASSCMLIAGAVECWGDNTYGQLGIGNASTTPVSVPTLVPGLESNVDQLSGGPASNSVCALQSGKVYCWGDNSFDDLGYATTAMCNGKPCSPSPQPVQFEGADLDNVTAIVGGANHTCATIAGQSSVCWGQDGIGQFGNGAISPTLSFPVAVSLPESAAVAGAGTNVTCYVLGGTQLGCSGYDFAFGSEAIALLGATATGLETCEYGYSCLPAPEPPQAVTQSAFPDNLALGLSMLCMRFGGEVDCWGDGQYGQLGNATTNGSATEETVFLPAAADFAAAGAHHGCARLTTGELVCWGLNDAAQLGVKTGATCTSNASCSTYPLIVPGLGRVADVAAGRYQTCAALDSGVVCWGGDMSDLMLGQGQDTCAQGPCSYTPIKIPFATH